MTNKETVHKIRDFFIDDQIDDEWRMNHTNVKLKKSTKTITIIIDNMNWQEFKWIHDAIVKTQAITPD